MVEQYDHMSKDEKIRFLNRIIEGEDYSTDYMPVLRQFLDDEEAEVRELALTGLWDYPRLELIDLLFDKARSDPSQRVRSRAIVTLGRYIYEGDIADYDFDWGAMEALMREDELPEKDFLRVKAFLLDILKDEGQPLDSRRFTVEAISFLNQPDILELIAEAYNHPDPSMKVSAIFAMGRNGNERWAPIILQELDSPIKDLQYEAVRAVGEAYLEEAAPQLKRLALSDDKELRLEAIWALGKTGGEGVEEFLKSCAQEKDEDIREVAEAALEEMMLFIIDEDEW